MKATVFLLNQWRTGDVHNSRRSNALLFERLHYFGQRHICANNPVCLSLLGAGILEKTWKGGEVVLPVNDLRKMMKEWGVERCGNLTVVFSE
jgi:hypothetical protein